MRRDALSFKAMAACMQAVVLLAALPMAAGLAGADTKPSDNMSFFADMALPFTPPPGSAVPVVHFKLNGTTDVALVVNTGSTVNAISSSLAKKLGLTPKPYLVGGKPYLIDGKPSSYVQANLTEGVYNFPDTYFFVIDDKGISALNYQSIDGMIGMNMLSGLAVYIDYPEHLVAFMDSKRLTRDEMASLGFPADSKPIPLTQTDQSLVEAPVELSNGSHSLKEKIFVNTGSWSSTLTHANSDKLHLESQGQIKVATPSNGQIAVATVTVPSIKIGPLAVKDFDVQRRNESIAGFSDVLAGDVLDQSRVLFDFPKAKMYLVPPASGTRTTGPALIGQSIFTLPFTSPWGYDFPVVRVRVNQKDELTVGINTGASSNIISKTAVARLGLKPQPYLVDGKPALFNGQPTDYVQFSELDLTGPYEWPDYEMLVLDDPYFAGPPGKPPVDAMIGLGTLNVNAILIDYRRHEITFMYPGNLTAGDVAALGFKGKAIPLTVSSDANIQLPFGLTHSSFLATENMVLSTASRLTTIARNTSDDLHLAPGPGDKLHSVDGGETPVSEVDPDAISAGDTGLKATKIYRYDQTGDTLTPAVGADVLSQYRVLIDFPAKKMYLSPLADISPLPPVAGAAPPQT